MPTSMFIAKVFGPVVSVTAAAMIANPNDLQDMVR